MKENSRGGQMGMEKKRTTYLLDFLNQSMNF